MNNQYKQLGEIFLQEARKPQAPVRKVPKGKKTTKAQGQQAMADDKDHPADRGRALPNLTFKRRHGINSWTTYSHMGELIVDGRRLRKALGTAALVGALVGGGGGQDAQQSQAPTSHVGGSPPPLQPLITRSSNYKQFMANWKATKRNRPQSAEDKDTTKLPHGQTGEGHKRGIRRGGGRRSTDWRSGYGGRHE